MTNDAYEGQGGSYLLNKKTGKRTLVSRTQEAAPEPEDVELLLPAPDTLPADFPVIDAALPAG